MDQPTARDDLLELLAASGMTEAIGGDYYADRILAKRDRESAQKIREEARGNLNRLAAAGRDALAALDDLIADSSDPGTAALGARSLLAQALLAAAGEAR